MQKIGQVDFLEFISIEEQNLLASMCNMRNEFDLFFNLDLIYKEPLSRLRPKSEDAVVPQLYFFCTLSPIYNSRMPTACSPCRGNEQLTKRD